MRHVILLLSLVSCHLAFSAIPDTISHRGRIVAAGTNFHGSGAFKFLIYEAPSASHATAAAIWKNAGTVDMTEPSNAVAVTVSKGLYHLALGDTNLSNMGALPTNLTPSSGNRLFLRIWFNDGIHGFQQLGPDQELNAVPFARHSRAAELADQATSALTATTVPDGSISASKLASGSVVASKIAGGNITEDKFAPGALNRLTASDGSSPDAVRVNSDGLVGIGSSTPLAGLDVAKAGTQGLFGRFGEISFGSVYAAAGSGNLLGVIGSATNTFSLYDMTNPATPVPRGTLTQGVNGVTTLDSPRDVEIEGNYAYVASVTALSIIDISDPDNPTIVGTIVDGVDASLFNGGKAIALSGNLACITTYEEDSLTLIDITNKAAPTILSERGPGDGWTEISTPITVATDGALAYVGSLVGDNLAIIDISTPTAPTITSNVTVGTFGVTHFNAPHDIILTGSFAHVLCRDSSGVITLDISNPAAPLQTSAFFDGIFGPSTENFLDFPLSMERIGTEILVGSYESLVVLDITTPSSPELDRIFRINEGSNPVVTDRIDYLASTDSGVHLVHRIPKKVSSVGYIDASNLGLHVDHRVGIGTTGTAEASLHVAGDVLLESERVSLGNSHATGTRSFAAGTRTRATGNGATALGQWSIASGSGSFATGIETISSGSHSLAAGDGTTSSGAASAALGFETLASGEAAIAIGSNTTASGRASFAAGLFSDASGTGATALGGGDAQGNRSLAFGNGASSGGIESISLGHFAFTSGDYSLALGYFSDATADYAAAIGRGAIASNLGMIALGNYNCVRPDNLLCLGNGTGSLDRSNAFEINKDASLVAFGELDLASPDIPVEGSGTRLMWYPDKAAFRAGHVELVGFDTQGHGFPQLGNAWDEDEVGNGSVAMGNTAVASGAHSLSIGSHNIASRLGSVAFGKDSESTADYAFASGLASLASGNHSVAIGDGASASGARSVAFSKGSAAGDASFAMGSGSTTAAATGALAFGNGTEARGKYSFAGGKDSRADNDYAFAFGDSCLARGDYSVAMGIDHDITGSASLAIGTDCNVESDNAAAIGEGVFSRGSNALAIGTYNAGLGTLFEIGNGTVGNTNTCFYVDSAGNVNLDGDIHVGDDVFYGGSLVNSSDQRLKEIGPSYERGLDEIEQLDVLRYHYKKDNPLNLPSDREKIGFVAQEVAESIPEAVIEGKDGYLRVDNQPILGALINAVKELNAENDQLRQRLDALESND